MEEKISYDRLSVCLSVKQTSGSEVNTRVLTVNTASCVCCWPEDVLVIRCRPEQQHHHAES